jgi:hypothetical protein
VCTLLPLPLHPLTQGATEMAQMEHLMNVYASKAAKGSIAEFIGYCEVLPREASQKLTEGLWLVRSTSSSGIVLSSAQLSSAQFSSAQLSNC